MGMVLKLCKLFLSLMVFSFTSYLLWFLTFPPSISIEMFQVPALNITSNGTIIDSTITFELRIKNENLNKGVFYDDVNVRLLYYHARVSKFSPIGNISIPAFYQGFHKKAHLVESIQFSGLPLGRARMEVLHGRTTMFRVVVNTRIRFQYFILPFWSAKSEKFTFGVGGNIPVNDQGVKSVKEGLRLSA